jgi:hypothetical protein
MFLSRLTHPTPHDEGHRHANHWYLLFAKPLTAASVFLKLFSTFVTPTLHPA